MKITRISVCQNCKKEFKCDFEIACMADIIVCQCQQLIKNRDGELEKTNLSPGFYFYSQEILRKAIEIWLSSKEDYPNFYILNIGK